MEKQKLPWLRELVNFGGSIVGIVLTAVGGVMFLNTVLKVYVFGFEINSYFSAEEMCQKEEYRSVPGPDKAVPTMVQELKVNTPEEIAQCKEEKTQVEKDRYSRQQKEKMVDGFAFFLVGVVLWALHRRKKKE